MDEKFCAGIYKSMAAMKDCIIYVEVKYFSAQSIKAMLHISFQYLSLAQISVRETHGEQAFNYPFLLLQDLFLLIESLISLMTAIQKLGHFPRTFLLQPQLQLPRCTYIKVFYCTFKKYTCNTRYSLIQSKDVSNFYIFCTINTVN